MVLPVPDSWKDARFYQQTRGIGEEGRSASGVPLVEGRPVASPIGGGMRSQIVAGVPVGQSTPSRSRPARAEEAGEGVEDPRSVGEWVPVEEPLFRAAASPGAKRQRIEPAPSPSGAAPATPRPRQAVPRDEASGPRSSLVARAGTARSRPTRQAVPRERSPRPRSCRETRAGTRYKKSPFKSRRPRAERSGESVPVDVPPFRADAGPCSKRQRVEPARSPSGVALATPRPRQAVPRERASGPRPSLEARAGTRHKSAPPRSKPTRAERAGESVPVGVLRFRADAGPCSKRQRVEPALSPSEVAPATPRPRTRAGTAHKSTLKAGEAAGVRVTPEVGQSVGVPRRLRIRGKCRACHAFGTRGTPAVDRTRSTDALDQQPPRLLGDARHWHYSDASACTLDKKATVTCRYCERDVRRDVLSRHRQSKYCQEKQRLYAVGGA